MGHQIIVQPDGLLCVWSTVVDDFLLTDATGQELVDWYTQQAADKAREETVRVVNAVTFGEAKKIYRQFTMTYDEAEATRRWRHGGEAYQPG